MSHASVSPMIIATYVWRRYGDRSNPAAIVEHPIAGLRGNMIWGTTAYDLRSHLVCIQSTITIQRYVDDVLWPGTLPYLQVRKRGICKRGPMSVNVAS
ncbi:transposable element Tc1 transposase [Nephila pilipes]|uniref:Transposable element Tc1 transposase n=1 Tax=Nephila pilipes TaxID=299642 RepID=A0A8X6Q0A8_NEPPI|nr:transposable element Tc1 transposase [Nephila pilipes]